ncbi:uncharacterized protein MP3633_0090 [Marinomonas primoryensis]|uniref:Uncharacterized protein n=1 Tax=Marinomonas primoryensis TaxID=178399 RepID=A0A859CRS6_9GAMM|nr:uncharacterized protein MP3633_0090 [Marinomonas primoryensis]
MSTLIDKDTKNALKLKAFPMRANNNLVTICHLVLLNEAGYC